MFDTDDVVIKSVVEVCGTDVLVKVVVNNGVVSVEETVVGVPAPSGTIGGIILVETVVTVMDVVPVKAVVKVVTVLVFEYVSMESFASVALFLLVTVVLI